MHEGWNHSSPSAFSVPRSFHQSFSAFSCSADWFFSSLFIKNQSWVIWVFEKCEFFLHDFKAILWLLFFFFFFLVLIFYDCFICLCRFEYYLYDYLVKNNMGETAEIFRREANLNFDPTRPPRNIFFSLSLGFYSVWQVVDAFLHVGLSFIWSNFWFYWFLCVLFIYKYIKMGSFFHD